MFCHIEIGIDKSLSIFYYDKITVKIFELTVMLIAIFFGCYIIAKDLAFTDNVNIETIIGFIVFMVYGLIGSIWLHFFFYKTPYEFIATEIKSWFMDK